MQTVNVTKGPFTQAFFAALSNATFVALELAMKIASVNERHFQVAAIS